jgi:5-methyltetrahydrofolate--homocysteine methyltransferase
MINMKEVIDAVRAAGINTNFILGGAVVTEAYAQSVGAFFAKDGVVAVKIVERLIKR